MTAFAPGNVVTGMSGRKSVPPDPFTLAASSGTVTRNSEVGACEQMSSAAAISGGVLGRNGVAAQEICAPTHRLKMLRIDAMTDATEMIEIHSIGDWPDEQFVGHTVGGSHSGSLSTGPDPAVATRLSAGEQPAAGGVDDDFLHQPILDGAHPRGHLPVILPPRSFCA